MSSSNPTLPPISTLSSLPIAQQLQVLDTLFEPSPELHTLMTPVLANQSFSSYDSLVDAVGGRLSALSAANSPQDRQVLYGILGSHPRLGASSAAAQAQLSELSRREQANINNDNAGAEDQATKLSALNQEYEEKYPGLRYVTFVNGRGRDVIMQDMRRRIDRGDFDREVEDNIQVCYAVPLTSCIQYNKCEKSPIQMNAQNHGCLLILLIPPSILSLAGPLPEQQAVKRSQRVMVVENRLRRLEEDVVEIAVDQLVPMIIIITVATAVFVVEYAVVIVCETQWGSRLERNILSSWRAWRRQWSAAAVTARTSIPRLITVSELKRSPLHPVQDGRFPEGTSTKTKGPLSRPDCNLGRAATDDVGGWNRERGAQPGGDQDQTQTTFLLCAGGRVNNANVRRAQTNSDGSPSPLNIYSAGIVRFCKWSMNSDARKAPSDLLTGADKNVGAGSENSFSLLQRTWLETIEVKKNERNERNDAGPLLNDEFQLQVLK
ncbi:hypothetical protein T310_7410 [Rasamsonia emersonii CBS 393.64]|uniref:Oxo-4-hydroxy-4-carboxy-5-ureidoimidazoline decarboxylase domain-containing protein n=1 Tax=Rasamsonia emersonii (strain ATCC 16479 / CBS 393.64 / IMI 116815) TaxID=1408163 RepID=A0A0F4YKL3_RASE3|nr:hypothetical protein T310_7410 [Rasamsonia emersonii CBS 393.64]KKA18640.1 hypothetical protein T310_7410 [Rasamsonia emersonii CBS 393.64]